MAAPRVETMGPVKPVWSLAPRTGFRPVADRLPLTGRRQSVGGIIGTKESQEENFRAHGVRCTALKIVRGTPRPFGVQRFQMFRLVA